MKKKNIILLTVIIITFFISLLTIAPSKMNYKDVKDYSAKNVLEDLQIISEDPHSVSDYENHENVRLYLKSRLGGLVGSSNVVERNYLTKNNKNPNSHIMYIDNNLSLDINEEYDIRNLVATMPGSNENGILLVAHYDSRGNIKRPGELAHSYGAADDGYGVASILEMLRYIKENNVKLSNSIYVLFTDAEETGMYGSYLEANVNKELMDKVNFVINIEARGMNGASYMFETSKNNSKVLNLYNKSKAKVTYSIAPAVYSIMTNFTDFTNFLEIGKTGLNFTTLNNIEDYHVPSDNYMNVNPASLQHYGEHILPIVLEYVGNAKYSEVNYFNASTDKVFFSFMPGIFVSYNEVIAYVIAVAVIIAFIVLIVLNVKKHEFNSLEFFKNIGYSFGVVMCVTVGGFIISYYVAMKNGYPWNLTNIREEHATIITYLYLIISMILSVKIITKKNEKLDTFLLSSVAINVLFLALTSFVLSGASFVFLFSSILPLVYLYLKHFNVSKLGMNILFIVYLIIFILLFVPLMTSLLYALTIGGLLAFALLTFIPFTTLIPMFKEYK